MHANPPLELPRIVRFGVVGLLNTAIGYAVIVAALALGCGDFLANSAGYAAGLALGFILNSRWTFATAPGSRLAMRYLAAFAVAYGANLAIVAAARAGGLVDHPLTHFIGICVYSVIFYLAAVRFAFVPWTISRQGDGAFSGCRRFASRWPEAALFSGLLGSYVLLRDMAVSHDVIWQMWIARQMLGGTGLYSGIMEINPPLWFWMALPVEWAAQALAVAPRQAIVAAVFLLIAASSAVVSALLSELPPGKRLWPLAAAFAAMVILPLFTFAQREHLALIASLPYAVLVARRAERANVDWRIATVAGLLAAAGFALKHYFVLVPVLLELWLIRRIGRKWKLFRPETIVLAASAAGYAAAVLTYAPEFLTTIVPMARLAYGGYEVPFLEQFGQGFVIFWILAVFVLWQSKRHISALVAVAAISALGFAAAYFAQQKGWGYHALPASGFLFFATVLLLPRHDWRGASPVTNVAVIGSIAGPLLGSLFMGPYSNPREMFVAPLLKDTRPGTVAVMLTGNPTNMWSMVEQAGLKWPSRHFAFWMVHAIFAAEAQHGKLPPQMAELAAAVRRQTVEDLSCNPPELIIVDDFTTSKSPGFDILRFFEEDPDFRLLLSHYSPGEKVFYYTPYRKSPAWQPPARPDCRTIH